MLEVMAKRQGVSMSDVVRETIRREFKKDFGNMFVCCECGSYASTQNASPPGWSYNCKKEDWVCPVCAVQRERSRRV